MKLQKKSSYLLISYHLQQGIKTRDDILCKTEENFSFNVKFKKTVKYINYSKLCNRSFYSLTPSHQNEI